MSENIVNNDNNPPSSKSFHVHIVMPGNTNCQSTRKQTLDFHFNASLTALNLLRMEDSQHHLNVNERNVIYITSWKIRKFNTHLLKRCFCHLKLDFIAIKSTQAFSGLCNYRVIAT